MKAELLTLREIALRFPKVPVISLAGAGGKTTLMYRLADVMKQRCVLSTTTKVGAEQILQADIRICCADFPPKGSGGTVWVSPSLEPAGGKIHGCSSPEFSELAEKCRNFGYPLICETDGAAFRHIKAPAEHEPVIPPETNVCFYLAGLDVLGSHMNGDTVHRPQLFSEICGIREGEEIRTEHIIRLFDHPEGGLKNMPRDAVRIAYLTHADTNERIRAGETIAERLQNYQFIAISE